MKLIASHMLEASVSDVTLEDGKFSVAGSPQKSVAFAEVAATANLSNTLASRYRAWIRDDCFFGSRKHILSPLVRISAVVEVDKDTGDVEITRYVAVDDCGRQLNPMLVEGQVHGGLAQGIGQALIEGVVYDEDGQLLTQHLRIMPCRLLQSYRILILVVPSLHLQSTHLA